MALMTVEEEKLMMMVMEVTRINVTAGVKPEAATIAALGVGDRNDPAEAR